jgi:hypothetical protein
MAAACLLPVLLHSAPPAWLVLPAPLHRDSAACLPACSPIVDHQVASKENMARMKAAYEAARTAAPPAAAASNSIGGGTGAATAKRQSWLVLHPAVQPLTAQAYKLSASTLAGLAGRQQNPPNIRCTHNMDSHLRASWRKISSVTCQNGNTVGMQTCSSGECAPLQRSNTAAQHQNGGLPLAIAYRSTTPPACKPSRDGGPVADAVQAGQLIPDDAALQTRMDGLHLRLLACTSK